MGFYVLHDDAADRAVLYDSTAEWPIACDGFIGGDAREQAESFLAYLHTEHNDLRERPDDRAVLRFNPADPRHYTQRGLELACERWRGLVYDPDAGELTPYGERLWQWWLGSRDAETPEPDETEVAS